MHFQVVPSAEPYYQEPPGDSLHDLPPTAQARLLAGPSDDAPQVKGAQWIHCDLRTFDYSVLGQ